MLTHLTLRNFKKHAELHVDFSRGVTAVIGPNYAGKSSVLDGIAFALWGPRAVAGGSDVCLKRGEDTLAVALGFHINGDDYIVKRTKSTATLWKGDTAVAKSASAVTLALQDLLGLNYQRFGQLKLARQKQTEALLTAGVTELHQIIEEVSGADVVSRIIDKASALATACRSALEVIPDEDPAPLRSEVTDLTTALAVAKQEQEPLQAKVEAGQERLTRAKQAVREAYAHNRKQESLAHDRDKLTSERDGLQGEKSGLQTELDSYAELPDLAALRQTEKELRDRERKQEHLARDRQRVARQLESYRRNAKAAADDLEQAEAELAEVPEVDEAALAKEVATHDDLADHLKLVRLELRQKSDAKDSAVCPTCHRPMEGHDPEELAREVADLEQRASEYSLKLKPLKAWIDDLQQDQKTRERLLNRVESLRERHAEADQLLQDTTEELNALPESSPDTLAQVQFDLTVVAKKLEKANRQHALAQDARRRLERVEARLKTLEEELANTPEPESDLDLTALEAELDEADSAYNTVQEALSSLNLRRKQLEGDLKAATERAFHVEQQAVRRRELQQRHDRLDKLIKYLRGNRDRFMAEVWGGVTAYAGQFASACTGGTISALQRSQEGAFTYLEDGDVFPVEAASGAQRSILGLGIQLALDQLLPSPLHTLLLDEPTADMTPEVSMAAATQLQSMGSQVVMITHRELDGSVADQVVSL